LELGPKPALAGNKARPEAVVEGCFEAPVGMGVPQKENQMLLVAFHQILHLGARDPLGAERHQVNRRWTCSLECELPSLRCEPRRNRQTWIGRNMPVNDEFQMLAPGREAKEVVHRTDHRGTRGDRGNNEDMGTDRDRVRGKDFSGNKISLLERAMDSGLARISVCGVRTRGGMHRAMEIEGARRPCEGQGDGLDRLHSGIEGVLCREPKGCSGSEISEWLGRRLRPKPGRWKMEEGAGATVEA